MRAFGQEKMIFKMAALYFSFFIDARPLPRRFSLKMMPNTPFHILQTY